MVALAVVAYNLKVVDVAVLVEAGSVTQAVEFCRANDDTNFNILELPSNHSRDVTILGS